MFSSRFCRIFGGFALVGGLTGLIGRGNGGEVGWSWGLAGLAGGNVV